MMGENKNLVPKRRFKEFVGSGDWKQRKLGDHAEILTGGTPSTSIADYWGPKEIPWMSSGEVNKRRLDSTDNMISNAGFENSNARWVREFSVLIALAGQGKTRGMVAINSIPLTTNQSIAAIVPDATFHYEFVFQNLLKRYDELRLISSGDGTRGGLNKQIVSDFIIQCPSVDEQHQVGLFFRTLDRLITLHQCKLEKMKALKAAYLSELFPVDGENKPKRRFKGFTDAWEQRKLGEVADIIGGGTPSTSNPEYWDGNIDWYSPVEIGNQIYVVGSQKKITNLGLQKSSARMLPVGTILFTSRAGIGKTAILDKTGCTNQGFQSIVPHKNHLDSYFGFSRTFELKRYGETNGAGSTFVEVSGKQMAEMPILLPSIEEQKKIGEFFVHIDKAITLHQRKLDKLQNLKSAYLNEMFAGGEK